MCGILIRVFVVYLPLLFLLVQANLLWLLPGIVIPVEVVCLWLFRAVQRTDGWLIHLLRYLGVGDIVWFSAALIFGYLSAVMPACGYAGMVILWLTALGLNILVARHPCDTPEPGAGIEKFALLPMLGRITSILTVQLAFGLVGIGLAGIMAAYVMNRDDWFLLSLSIMSIGLSCGFSPQIGPLLRHN